MSDRIGYALAAVMIAFVVAIAFVAQMDLRDDTCERAGMDTYAGGSGRFCVDRQTGQVYVRNYVGRR